MGESLPALLQCERVDDRLILRVDSDFHCADLAATRPVETLTLVACSGAVAIYAQFIEALGRHIGMETEPAVDGFCVHAYLDYGADSVEFFCKSVARVREPYSLADLLAKSKFLARELRLYSSSYENTYAQLNRLRERLRAEIDKEADRAARKESFFQEHGSPRSQRFEGERRVYARILQLLRAFDEEERTRAKSDHDVG